MLRSASRGDRAAALLQRHWWRPQVSLLARLLLPLAWLYGALAARQRRQARPRALPVPVLVVGNYVAGGAGKTPAVIALVQALRERGHRPGVVSRGYGGNQLGPYPVRLADRAAHVGDEPLLIRRRSGVPVWIGRERWAVANALCQHHPEVDVIVADDGLQHHALPRAAELVVFDERGAGNGLLLPAGPLRQPLPERPAQRTRVLYTAGVTSTALPGALALRQIARAWPLAGWLAGDGSGALPLAALRGRALVAAAGIAMPEKFFAALEAAGLTIKRLALPDHHDYATLPWPPHSTDVITTEKDAVKLDAERIGTTRVWVVPLDLQLPAALIDALCALLFATPTTDPEPPR